MLIEAVGNGGLSKARECDEGGVVAGAYQNETWLFLLGIRHEDLLNVPEEPITNDPSGVAQMQVPRSDHVMRPIAVWVTSSNVVKALALA